MRASSLWKSDKKTPKTCSSALFFFFAFFFLTPPGPARPVHTHIAQTHNAQRTKYLLFFFQQALRLYASMCMDLRVRTKPLEILGGSMAISSSLLITTSLSFVTLVLFFFTDLVPKLLLLFSSRIGFPLLKKRSHTFTFFLVFVSCVYYIKKKKGIYRYVNNPDCITGYFGYYGMALMCQNMTLFALAFSSHFLNIIFVYLVEVPHMHRLYNNIREVSPIPKAMRRGVKRQMEKVETSIKRRRSSLQLIKSEF